MRQYAGRHAHITWHQGVSTTKGKSKSKYPWALPLTKRVYQLLYFGLLWWFPLPFHRNVTEKANLIPSWIYSLSSNPWVLLPILSHDGLHFCKKMLTIDWKTWDSSFSRCWPLKVKHFPIHIKVKSFRTENTNYVVIGLY